MSIFNLQEWKERLNNRYSGEPQPVEEKLKSALADVEAGRLDLDEQSLKTWATEHDVPEDEHERFIREALASGENESEAGQEPDLAAVLKSVNGLVADVAALREDAEDLFGPGIAFAMDRVEELEQSIAKLKAGDKEPEQTKAPETEKKSENDPETIQKLKSQIAELEEQVKEIGAQPVNVKQPVTERTDAPNKTAPPKRSAVLRVLQKGYSAGRLELADITQFETSGELSRRAESYWSEVGEKQTAA